jgi:hypothetical protein
VPSQLAELKADRVTASELADTAEQHQRAAAVAQERCRLVEAAKQEQAAQSAAREDKWRRAVRLHTDPHCLRI